jgi:hypothetical protein
MNSTIAPEIRNLTSDTDDADRHSRTRRIARTALAAALAAVVGVTMLAAAASPASAATAGWRYYQTDRDYCYDAQIWVDSYGRLTANGWFDLNNDCRFETLARDANGDFTVDEVWVDYYYGGSWDFLVIGPNVWEGQNGSTSYISYPGPYGTYWARNYQTYATVGGRPSSPSALYTFALSSARSTGSVYW